MAAGGKEASPAASERQTAGEGRLRAPPESSSPATNSVRLEDAAGLWLLWRQTSPAPHLSWPTCDYVLFKMFFILPFHPARIHKPA